MVSPLLERGLPVVIRLSNTCGILPSRSRVAQRLRSRPGDEAELEQRTELARKVERPELPVGGFSIPETPTHARLDARPMKSSGS